MALPSTLRIPVIILAILLLGLGSAAGAGTRSETQTYVGPIEPIGFCGGGALNKGCAIFPSLAGDTGVTIVATDALGFPVAVTVCQNVNGNNSCGEPGDATAAGCGSARIDAANGFRAEFLVHAHVFATPFFGAPCDPAPVSTGEIVATFTTS